MPSTPALKGSLLSSNAVTRNLLAVEHVYHLGSEIEGYSIREHQSFGQSFKTIAEVADLWSPLAPQARQLSLTGYRLPVCTHNDLAEVAELPVAR